MKDKGEKFKIKRTIVIEEEVTHHEYIAQRLKQIRKKRGLNQTQLSKKIGLSRTSIVNMESGNQKISIDNLYMLCKILDVKSSEFLPF